MKIAVLSDGAWGTALGMTLLDNGHEVVLWGPFPDYLESMRKSRENSRFLPGVKLPDTLSFESDMGRAVEGAEVLLLATPTQFLRSVLAKLKPHYDPVKQLLLDAAKGIEVDTLLRIDQMGEAVLGPNRYAVISGPSHAEEVSRRVPTAVVAASADPADAELVQQIFINDSFRVYTGNDVIGVELGGALKNVFAIAAGIIDGMKLGDNPKAALMTRGISEMGRLGECLGGCAQTFSGLSGVGDLIVTCCSGHSRNRHVGEELGRGKKLPEILESMGMVVAEGVTTAQSAHALARRVGAETPIIDEIYAILYHDRNVPEAIRNLMSRSAKPE